MLKKILALILVIGSLAPQTVWGAADFLTDIKTVYDTYSQYLDTQWVALGWEYNVPSRQYHETDQISIDDIRLQATLATAYRWRLDDDAKYKIKSALTNILGPAVPLVNSVPNKSGIYTSTRGFGDMIGLYLALKLANKRADIFTKAEQAQISASVKTVFPFALAGYDNENRALLSAAYGLAILRNSAINFTASEKANYKKQIENKIKIGLAAIDGQGIYREGKDKTYSLHYQLVSALALAYLGQNLPNKNYSALAKTMLAYVHKRYPLGQLDWRGSARPNGIGLQTVLLRAWGEKYSGNNHWLAYWQTEKEGRGFIDNDNPGRLAWRDDVDKTINDDYSFLNMAELFYAN